MKVTALLPDKLIADVKQHAKAQTLTESLLLALSEWVQMKELSKLDAALRRKPLKMSETAAALRSHNRRRG